MKLKVPVVAVLVLASAMTSAFARGNSSTMASKNIARPLICTRSYNPYREPVSVLRSCGDVIYTLRHVTPLPGGGEAYDYGAYTQLVPPPHFNPLKASDRRLQEYGLPTRQKFGSRWRALVSAMRHPVTPPPYMVGVPAAHPAGPYRPDVLLCSTCSDHWSGWVAKAGHSYNGIGTGWYEPDFVSDPCSPTAFSQWIGIGGYPAGVVSLGQEGTAFGEEVAGIGSHQAWIETLDRAQPQSPPFPISGLYGTIDQKFVASESFNPSVMKYYYDMANDYTGKSWSGESRVVNSYSETSAEVIAERPYGGGGNGGFYDLSDFQSFTVTQPGVDWGSTGSSNFYNLPSGDKTHYDMVDDPNGTNLMAYPGSLDPSDSNFTNNYNSCN